MAEEPEYSPEDLESEEDLLRRFDAWAERHWNRTILCPICEGDEWERGGVAQVPLELPKGRSYPLVAIMCLTCGNTLLINAYLGDLKAQEPE